MARERIAGFLAGSAFVALWCAAFAALGVRATAATLLVVVAAELAVAAFVLGWTPAVTMDIDDLEDETGAPFGAPLDELERGNDLVRRMAGDG